MLNQETGKPRSESITFRIEKSLLEKLHQESEQKQTSLNTLASQVFKQHVDWHANAAKAGLISFPKALLIRIMDKLTDEEIAQTAKYIVDTQVKDIILLLRREYDLPAFLDVVESWIRASGLPCRRQVNDGVYTCVIQHDMSIKWSLYLKELFQLVFEELASKKAEFDVTGNTFVFKVDAGKGSTT